jgi:hypothetical protein
VRKIQEIRNAVPTCEDVVLLAAYNASMNRKLYAAAAQLPEAELFADRKAFFSSLSGTLNHMCPGTAVGELGRAVLGAVAQVRGIAVVPPLAVVVGHAEGDGVADARREQRAAQRLDQVVVAEARSPSCAG